MLKEKPYELNQKFKRMRNSRDKLKQANQDKMLQNKAFRDRNAEIAESRNMWRSRTRELEKALADQIEDFSQKMETAKQTIEEEKRRTERERERTNLLQSEIENLTQKKSRS